MDTLYLFSSFVLVYLYCLLLLKGETHAHVTASPFFSSEKAGGREVLGYNVIRGLLPALDSRVFFPTAYPSSDAGHLRTHGRDTVYASIRRVPCLCLLWGGLSCGYEDS